MATLEELLKGSETEWIDALPAYQREIIKSLISQGKTPEEAATAWLSASGPANTFTLGTVPGRSLFYEKLLDEVEAFICREDKYQEERNKLLTDFKSTAVQGYIIGAISVAIAPTVGAAAAFIAPAVAVILLTITRIGRNAWCAMRKEQRSGSHG